MVSSRERERLVVVAEVMSAFPVVSWFPTFRFDVVALVPVAEVKVRVEMFARVAAKSVEVAKVEVLFVDESDWIVDDPRPMKLVN